MLEPWGPSAFVGMEGPPPQKRRRIEASESDGDVPGTCIPFVILARTLTPWLWHRVERLVAAGFDAHIVQDKPLAPSSANTYVGQALLQDRLHYISDGELEAAGYHDINSQVVRKKVTAWERGLFWATQRSQAASRSSLHAPGSNVESGPANSCVEREHAPPAAWADRVFFSEDDAQWTDATSLGLLCRHILDSPAVDLLAQKIAWSPKEDPGWPSWGAGFRYFKQEHLAAAFMPFCCLSSTMLREVHAFAAKHKTLIYLEVLFASLAKQHGMRVRWFQESSVELPVASRWRPDFSDVEIEAALSGFCCPCAPRALAPGRALVTGAAELGSECGEGNPGRLSSLTAETAAEPAPAAPTLATTTLPAYPVVFHPVKRECGVWAVWESGETMVGTRKAEAGEKPMQATAAAPKAAAGAGGPAFTELLAATGYGDDI